MKNAAAEWRNRPLQVIVRDLCEHCRTLQTDVGQRDFKSFWPSYGVSMKSCVTCFDAAKAKARSEAMAGNVAVC